MTDAAAPTHTSSTVRTRPDSGRDDRTHLELVVDGARVAWLTIDRMELQLGRGETVAMDAIGNVFTDESRRGEGHARRLVQAAIEHMQSGDAAISMLYGIDDFYDRLGWVRAGDEQWLQLVVGPRGARNRQVGELPTGWTARAARTDDLAAMQAIYEAVAVETVGAAVRAPTAPAWLALDGHVCGGGVAVPRGVEPARVLLDGEGEVVAYALHGAPFGVSADELRRSPGALVLGELHARDAEAADASLTMAKAWAVDVGGVDAVHVACAPGSALAAAATAHPHCMARHVRPRGGSMVLLLDADRWSESVAGSTLAKADPATAWTSESVADALVAADQFLFVPDRY